MTDTKTHWKKFHNPDYIGAYAFMPGETKVLTIQQAVQESVQGSQGKKDDCLVVHFNEDEKPLICNVTNSKAIARLADSSFIEDWPGTAIELFVTEVSAFGDTVEAVRIKTTAPKVKKVDTATALKHIGSAKTLEELKAVWAGLSPDEKKAPEVMKAKEDTKVELSKTEEK